MNIKDKLIEDYNDRITSSSSLRSSSSYGSYTDLWLSFSKKEIEIFFEFLKDILTMKCEINHLNLSMLSSLPFQQTAGFYTHVRVILV